ncbi:MAG: hypothetical protein V4484_10555 [Pseudomonadota bacterium]
MSPLNGVTPGVTDVTDNAPAAAALLAQLQRLQQQLAECVNCASAKTTEGKAAADAIRSRISQVEGRIVQSDQVHERREAQLRAGKAEPAASVAAASATVPQVPKTSNGPGQIIDVFA